MFLRAATRGFHKLRGLRPQEFLLMVLEARGPKLKYQQGHTASEGAGSMGRRGRGEFFLPQSSFRCLPLFLGLWQHLPTSVLSLHGPLYVQIPLFFPIQILVIEFRDPMYRMISSQDPQIIKISKILFPH